MTGWEVHDADSAEAAAWIDKADLYERRNVTADEFRRNFMALWCGGRVEINGHYLPCTKDEHHDGPCDVYDRTKAIRQHLIGPDAACFRAGCPAYTED